MKKVSYFRFSAVCGLVAGFVSSLVYALYYICSGIFVEYLPLIANVSMVAVMAYFLFLYRKKYAISPFTFGLGMKVGLVMSLVCGVSGGLLFYADPSLMFIGSDVELQSAMESFWTGGQMSRMAFVSTIMGTLFGGLVLTALIMLFLRERKSQS